MDPTCGLVEKFRDIMLNLIWEQLHNLLCYGQNIEELNERIKDLSIERISIQRRIDEATNNAESVYENVLHWMEEVRQISEQVETLCKDSQAKRGCSITSCPNPWLRYRLSRRAKKMAQQVDAIYAKRNFDRVAFRAPPKPIPELPNGEGNEGIDSRVPIMNQIMEALQDPSVNMIGLWGPGGVGKTTIAKDVAKNQKIFEKVIMAIVSQQLDIAKIQCQIAEKLGMQLNETTEDVRASRLHESLKEEKSMLLILDDLWEELDLVKVGIPFTEGCKILLTSRNETLLSNRMKCKRNIKVSVLLENEALGLFQRIADLSTDISNDELINISTKIVQKLDGLPLAIATAAKKLTGEKDINVWKDYLQRLTKLSRNITGIRGVDHSLRLSYDPLSSEYKNVFLYAAMLSHDPSIEDLLMYSVGLNILERTTNMKDAWVRISAIVSKLKSLNLFLDSLSCDHFTIHDVFRDVALSIASNELPAFIHRTLKEWPDENMPKACKGICFQESDISELPEELNGSSLEFLFLNSKKRDLTIPNMFFKSLKELKVLSFSNVHFPSLPLLSFLQKLRALCLHSCLLKDITEVRSLKKLKVLSFANSEIQQLPVELAELTYLQMLNLSDCSKLKVIPPKVLSSLKKLEVLNMRKSFDQWKVEGSSEATENASLDELKDLPIHSLDIRIPSVSMLPENLFLHMNLERYTILVGEHYKWWHVKDGTSKILKLELERGIHLKQRVGKLLDGVEDLHLYGSNGNENLLYSHDGRGFPHLRHLRIESNNDIKYFILNSAHHEDVFPILESLQLKNLKAFQKLCQGSNVIVFHRLHTLKMKYLPAIIANLNTKDRATNDECNKISKSLFNDKVIFPKLQTLVLSNLNRMIPSIWDGQLSHNSFRNLTTLKMERCGFVKLGPLHLLVSLNCLETLEVENCAKFEMVFDCEDLDDYREMGSSPVVMPLKKLWLWKLPKLKNVWNNYYQGNVSFPSLRRVYVSDCKSLTSVFPASIAKGMLHDLEEIQIDGCDMNTIVAEDQAYESNAIAFEFPRLTSLAFVSLPNLKNFYPQRHTLKWPLLQKLYIQCCDQLQIFEKEISSQSEIHEEDNTLDSKYPLLCDNDKVIHSLEELTLQGKHVQMIGSGQILLDHFPKLKRLFLSLEEHPTEPLVLLWKGSPNIGELYLSGNVLEKVVGGDNVAALAACFSKLTLHNISTMGSLSSSFVSLSNLTHLQVSFSDGLITLTTSSVARNLIHITHLSISYCYQMEEIITKCEGEDDEDMEILFNKLESLELEYLPRLKRFCAYNYAFRFPFLQHITITKCPRLTTFCSGDIHAPLLQSVQLKNHAYEPHHEDIWLIDLNNTIQHQYTIKEVISTTKSMTLSAKNMSMIRDVFPEVESLYVESFQDEGVTFPYSSLVRFPKLYLLYVEHCSFEEIFPSQDRIIDFMGKIPPFEELCIVYLDKLKSIWKDDSQLPPIHQNLRSLQVRSCCNLLKLAPSSASFPHLWSLNVSGCHELIHLVTTSTAKSLVSLMWLKINDCEKMEEIVMNDTNDEDVQAVITFSQLWMIKLADMPNLKMFSSQSHTFEFPELEKIEITGCPQMKMFCPGVLETPKLSEVKIEEHDMEWEDQGDLNQTIRMLSSAKDNI